MALTIVSQPPSIAGSNSPMIYDLYSDNNGSANHQYTLNVFIWKGTTGSIPALATYTLRKSPNSAGKALFDVSRLVREFITLSKVTDITASGASITNCDNDVVWVKGVASASWTGGSDTAVNSNIVLGTFGYSLYNSGTINTAVTGFPVQNSLKIHSTGRLSIPLFMSIADELVITDSSSNTKTFTPTTNTDSKQQVKLLNVSPSEFTTYGLDTSGTFTLEFKLSAAVVHTAYLEILCEAKYTPMQLIYINSNGMWDYMTFFKASTNTIEAKRTSYFNTNISYGDNTTAVSYSPEQGEQQAFLSNGYMSHVLNTGYVSESENARIKELLLSDRVIMHDGTDFYGVEVLSNSQTLKQGINEKVINYTISVKETARIINKVA